MDSQKNHYLGQIRSNTAYPAFREIIRIIEILGYCLAAVNALGTILSGVSVMRDFVVTGVGILAGGLIVSILIFFGARFLKEAALVLADIGDSIADSHSKTQ